MIERETLFKAKRIDNGEWEYGDYFKSNTSKAYIMSLCDDDSGRIVRLNYIEVDPTTKCEYIGETDQYAHKIFEHDIVETDECGWVAEVIFEQGMFYCLDNFGGYAMCCNWGAYTILGNTIDSPKMLKREHDYE